MVKLKIITTPLRAYSRKAFTMIELIFAIVILAVVMLTIPMMIQVNNKALEGNVAQEAIFLVSAVLSGSTTLLWDDNSLEGDVDDGISLSKILDTGGDTDYNRVDINTTLRSGGLDEDLHRNFFSIPKSPEQNETRTLTDILDTTDTSGNVGYKIIYSVDATRGYVDDTPAGFEFNEVTLAPGVTSNVKMTQVEISAIIDDENVTISRLRAYTCNIGEIDFAKRRME